MGSPLGLPIASSQLLDHPEEVGRLDRKAKIIGKVKKSKLPFYPHPKCYLR